MFKNNNRKDKNATKVKIDPDMKDYSNEPFFMKKAEASKKNIEKYGIPKNLLSGKK